MDFTDNYDMFLGEEHDLLRKTVRDFAKKEVAPHIRAWDRSGAEAGEGPETRPHIRPLLKRMGELWLPRMPTPCHGSSTCQSMLSRSMNSRLAWLCGVSAPIRQRNW